MEEDIPDVITCFKFGDDRFRGLASAEGQILPFPIDFDGRPYDTLTLPCERVISPKTFECLHVLLFFSQFFRRSTDALIGPIFTFNMSYDVVLRKVVPFGGEKN